MSADLVEVFNKFRWSAVLGVDFYGTRFGIKFDDKRLVGEFCEVFPMMQFEDHFIEVEGYFLLVTNQTSEINGFYWFSEGKLELVLGFENFNKSFWSGIEIKLLFTLALISSPRMFYFHAGAVSIDGKGILIPGKSFSGKTTITEEFIKNGAVYYSDDCSLIDSKGFLYPYPVKLGIRGKNERKFLSAKEIGAVEAFEPVKIEFILFTSFEEAGIWSPQFKKSGQMTLQLLEHLFYRSVVIRNPKETLEFVANLTKDAKIIESPRGEASDVVRWFNGYFAEKK